MPSNATALIGSIVFPLALIIATQIWVHAIPCHQEFCHKIKVALFLVATVTWHTWLQGREVLHMLHRVVLISNNTKWISGTFLREVHVAKEFLQITSISATLSGRILLDMSKLGGCLLRNVLAKKF